MDANDPYSLLRPEYLLGSTCVLLVYAVCARALVRRAFALIPRTQSLRASLLALSLNALFVASSLRMYLSPDSTYSLSFAFSRQATRRVVALYSAQDRMWLTFCYGLDFVVIASYSCAYAFMCVRHSDDEDAQDAAAGQLLIGAMHACEVLLLTSTLARFPDFDWRHPFLAGVCAILKTIFTGLVWLFLAWKELSAWADRPADSKRRLVKRPPR
jgi:hypothetical protein